MGWLTSHTNRTGQCSWCSDLLQAGWPGVQTPVEARYSLLGKTGPEAHPASCATGTRCLSPGQSGQGVALTTHTTVTEGEELYLNSPSEPSWFVAGQTLPLQAILLTVNEVYIWLIKLFLCICTTPLWCSEGVDGSHIINPATRGSGTLYPHSSCKSLNMVKEERSHCTQQE